MASAAAPVCSAARALLRCALACTLSGLLPLQGVAAVSASSFVGQWLEHAAFQTAASIAAKYRPIAGLNSSVQFPAQPAAPEDAPQSAPAAVPEAVVQSEEASPDDAPQPKLAVAPADAAKTKGVLFQTSATASRLGAEINRTEEVLAAGKSELRLFSDALSGLSQFAKMTSDRQQQLLHKMSWLESAIEESKSGSGISSSGSGISSSGQPAPGPAPDLFAASPPRNLTMQSSLVAAREQSEAEAVRLRDELQRAQARAQDLKTHAAMGLEARNVLVSESKAKRKSQAESARLREELEQARASAQDAREKADKAEEAVKSEYARLYDQWSADRQRMKAMYEQWSEDRLRLQEVTKAHKEETGNAKSLYEHAYERARVLYDRWSEQKDAAADLYEQWSSMKDQLAQSEEKAAKAQNTAAQAQEKAAQARMAQQLAEEEAMHLWKMQGQMLDAQEARVITGGAASEPGSA